MDSETERTLAAVAARILPSGEDGAGAQEAGVPEFLRAALGHRVYAGLREKIERGLEILGAQANEQHGKAFADCSAQQQEALLRQAQQSRNFLLRLVFDTLVTLTVEGYLADPIHGGNRDFVGWRLIGCETAAVRSGFCQQVEAER